MPHFARHLVPSKRTWLITVLIIVLSAGVSLTAASASAAARSPVVSSTAPVQHANAVAVSPTHRSTAPAAGGTCTEFVNAQITEYSDKTIGFSSSNQCSGVAPAQTIDVTLLDQNGNELDYADNSCGSCQILGASGVWPGPAVAGQTYTMDVSTVLVLPSDEQWVEVPQYCVLVNPQTLSCQASASIVAQLRLRSQFRKIAAGRIRDSK